MKNILAKIGDWVKARQKDIFLSFCMLLIAVIGYNLGKINSLKQTPITITGGEADVYSAVSDKNQRTPKNTQAQVIDRRVVVSKNSDKYHFTWCSGVKRIKEENKIWFETEAAAQAAGYAKAGNCN
ncbi:MAG: hypothetical protein HYT66_01040 [Candidatus Yanofskybacteria bacterium]|nr:hypothetical protein [Candidatus Yanofskybacteria bacterium]